MQRPLKLLIAGLVVIAVVAVWFIFRPGTETVVMNLVTDLPAAKERRPAPEVFSVVTATLDGEERQAILIKDPAAPQLGLAGSRVRWELTVPENAWLGFSLGVMPEGWTVPGDGVLFRIGVSDMSPDGYDEVLSITVNPYANSTDRRWQHLTVDLSPYAGQRVELILNTNSSPPAAPGAPPRDDRQGDLALWGAPRIFVR